MLRCQSIRADAGQSLDIAPDNFARAVMAACAAKVEVVKRMKDGFEVLPRRWVANANLRLVRILSTIAPGL